MPDSHCCPLAGRTDRLELEVLTGSQPASLISAGGHGLGDESPTLSSNEISVISSFAAESEESEPAPNPDNDDNEDNEQDMIRAAAAAEEEGRAHCPLSGCCVVHLFSLRRS